MVCVGFYVEEAFGDLLFGAIDVVQDVLQVDFSDVLGVVVVGDEVDFEAVVFWGFHEHPHPATGGDCQCVV